ncbi:MAG: hypothetical protein ACR2LT_01030 [Pyrinomonadaceae bacterium]
MTDKVEVNEARVVEDKSKRNVIIWIFVGALLVFLIVFLIFISGVFSSNPSGGANFNASQGQTNRANP